LQLPLHILLQDCWPADFFPLLNIFANEIPALADAFVLLTEKLKLCIEIKVNFTSENFNP
jgi:hypothetical protein